MVEEEVVEVAVAAVAMVVVVAARVAKGSARATGRTTSGWTWSCGRHCRSRSRSNRG
jgi:hypothetical protein